MRSEDRSRGTAFGATVHRIGQSRKNGTHGTRYVSIPKKLAEEFDLYPGVRVVVRLEKLGGFDEY